MLRVVVADANVLLAAAVGKAAQMAFLAPIEVCTTQHTMDEVLRYIPHFAKRYSFTVEEVQRELADLPILILERTFYRQFLEAAKAMMAHIDPDDVDLLALALKLGAPVWSNDAHFGKLPIKTYTTATLLKLLGI